MKEYFSHDYNTTNDPKIIALLGDYGAVGYGIYWRIVELLHSESSHSLPFKKYIFLSIAKQMSTPVEQVESIVESCITIYELFTKNDDCFYCKRVFENIETRNKISESRSKAGKISAERRKNATSVEHVLTSVEQNSTKLNKEKKIKENESKVNKIEIRKEKFKEDLKPFLEIYGKDLLNDFFLYWTEMNKDGKKMRFEMQSVFDIKRRLITWHKNSTKNNFSKEQKTIPLIADTSEVDKARRLQAEYLNSLKQHESLIN
jgi:hypothetical protein